MANESNIVRYTYELKEATLSFAIDTAPETADPSSPKNGPDALPEWTRLTHHRCPGCPLDPATTSHCPAATRLHKALEAFKHLDSIDTGRVTVETKRRSYVLNCDLQSSLNSMIGLIMATSGCPVVGRLRSMATFHLPYASFAETLYRAVSAYLVKQYFTMLDGGEPDWKLEGLKAFYRDLEALNQAFSARITNIARGDAISNAMVMFFSASVVAGSAIEEQLEEYKAYFTGESIQSPDGD